MSLSESSQSSPRRPALPGHVDVEFTLKYGDRNSRTSLGTCTLTNNTRAGLEVLLGQCRHELFKDGSVFEQHREKIRWGQGSSDVLYLKQANSTKQADYIALTQHNYVNSLTEAWRNFNAWRGSSEEFIVRVFAYSPRQRATSANPRATAARITESLSEIENFISQNGLSIGEPAARFLAAQRAREINPGPVSIPTNNPTFNQLVHIGSEQAAIEEVDSAAETAFMSIKLNDTWINVEIKVSELRLALGLPPYNLMQEGFYSRVTPPDVPLTSSNINDSDHFLSNDLANNAEEN
jgi:hypothetical protein